MCRDDLKQRLDSKSALGEYVGNLYDSASYMTANQSVVHSLLAYTHGAAGSDTDTEQSAVVATLLTLLAKHSPQVPDKNTDKTILFDTLKVSWPFLSSPLLSSFLHCILTAFTVASLAHTF